MIDDRSNPRERVIAEQERPGLVRVGYPIGACHPKIIRTTEVTPRMVRVTLGGPEVAGLHTYQCDDHVRIVLADPDGTVRAPVPNDRLMLDWPKPMPPSRKYTVRRYDPDTQELDLDFVRHPGGLAAGWAESVEAGERVVVAGPPGAKTFPHRRSHHLFIVDFTALPAAARWLEESPSGARTDLIVVAEDPSDQAYPLTPGEQDTVAWVSSAADVLPAAARVSGADDTFVFVAGETGMVADVRKWSKEHGLDVLATGYWKRGVTDFDD